VVLVAGNPNSGKSTLFNALTGADVKVGNYPGVTVTRTHQRMIELDGIGPVDLVDLPGTYSLSARSQDEQVAVDAVLGRAGVRPDAVLIVADATALGRALYLAGENYRHTGRPRRGSPSTWSTRPRTQFGAWPSTRARLATDLGVPVSCPSSSRARHGLGDLRKALATALRTPRTAPTPVTACRRWPNVTSSRCLPWLRRELPGLGDATRAWSMWGAVVDRRRAARRGDGRGVPVAVRGPGARRFAEAAQRDGRNLDLEIIGARYERVVTAWWVGAVRPRFCRRGGGPSRIGRSAHATGSRVSSCLAWVMLGRCSRRSSAGRSRAIAVHRAPGGAGPGGGVSAGAALPGAARSAGRRRHLPGVGNVDRLASPQIGLLFLFIGVMEDAGYLARVAFVIESRDGAASACTASRSCPCCHRAFRARFRPVMATRTLENRTEPPAGR
jgi:ferrous iron transport protein B